MLKNENLIAKIGVDTTKNDREVILVVIYSNMIFVVLICSLVDAHELRLQLPHAVEVLLLIGRAGGVHLSQICRRNRLRRVGGVR